MQLTVANAVYLGIQLVHSEVISFLEGEGYSATSAEALGTYLAIPRPNMNIMMRDNPRDSKGLFYAVIESWLSLPGPTWEKLADALDKSDSERIAKKLQGS